MSLNPETRVTLREITKETLYPVLKLQVAPAQQGFVAPNAASIAEAYFTSEAWFRAIYADETPVGFVMLYIDHATPRYDIWRFMIDQRYQGQGYGRQAIELVLDHVRQFPQATEVYLSYVPEEGNACPFYTKLGFVETGHVEDGEREMKLGLRAED